MSLRKFSDKLRTWPFGSTEIFQRIEEALGFAILKRLGSSIRWKKNFSKMIRRQNYFKSFCRQIILPHTFLILF